MTKRYDRSYFDKWYRDPGHRVSSRMTLELKVRLALATAEYHLGRPVSSVLDIGCGEGAWRPILCELRPEASYLGLESSEYAVRRYGLARNIRPATFGQLAELRFDRAFDLIVCADVLHYVRGAELERGLRGLAEMLHGLAFIEVYTANDAIEGDLDGFLRRSARWYRQRFIAAGLVACGSHCYLGPRLAADAAALEVSTTL